MEFEATELTDDVRESLPGAFTRLTDGFTHHELDGPEDGEVIVLVHGFSAPSFVWDHNFPYLVERGFRVLRYDIYCRGYSDRPETYYNMDLFVRQLHELVDALGLTEKGVNLVGLSMGGGISIIFADRYPDLVRKVSLIDPMGFSIGGLSNKLFLWMLRAPGLKGLLKVMMGHGFFVNSQRGDLVGYDNVEGYLERYREQLRYKGFLRAIWSTVENVQFVDLREAYRRVGERTPMQLFWGELDASIPFSVSEEVRATLPSIVFHPVAGAGHQPQYTHAGDVNPRLAEFLGAP